MVDEQDASLRASQVKPAIGWVCRTCGLRLPGTTLECPQDGTRIEAGTSQIDQSLAERYEFIGVIGSGGMSVIYKARQKLLNKTFAIKMLHSHMIDATAISRFQQEAKAALSLKHPNVIAVHDFGVTEHGQPFMIMDYIEGFTLENLIQQRGTIELPEALFILEQVCDALEHAHSHGILHRDLKPSNIMLIDKPDGWSIRLVDFGIAKIVEGGNSVANQLTKTGELVGSPLYMSPENCMGRKVDQRSDIYSLGCILYEMLTGRVPHCGETLIETMFKHLNEDPQGLHEACPELMFPQSVEEFVMKLLATKPENRYQNMTEVRQKLASMQAGALGREQKAAHEKRKVAISKPALVTAFGIALCAVGLVCIVVANGKWQEADRLRQQSGVPSSTGAQQTGSSIFEKERREYYTRRLRTASPSELTDENLSTWLPFNRPITDLNLSNAAITDQAIETLRPLKELRSLNLSNTKITDRCLPALTSLTDLTELNVAHTGLSEQGLGKLAALKNLQKLSMERTSAGDATLESLSSSPSLSVVNLRDTGITDQGIQALARAPRLAQLEVSGTAFGDAGLKYLANTKVNSLHMSDTKVTGAGLQAIASMRSLGSLTLRHLSINDKDLVALQDLPRLDFLDLAYGNITDAGVGYLSKNRNLKDIVLQSTNVTDKCAAAINAMPQMRSINMSRTKITDAFIFGIPNLKDLQNISVNSDAVTDAGMAEIAKHKGLTRVDASGTHITDNGLASLAKLENLKDISLWDCTNLSRRGDRLFREKRPDCNVNIALD